MTCASSSGGTLSWPSRFEFWLCTVAVSSDRGQVALVGELRGPTGCRCSFPPPCGLPSTSLRHPVDPRSSEDGWRTKLGTNSTAYQLPCQIRAVWRSAQRHQGGAHRAGDSRGAECHAALIPQGP